MGAFYCLTHTHTHLIVLSEEPLTTSRSLYWRQAIPRLWPFRVRTNSQVLVLHTCRDNTSDFNPADDLVPLTHVFITY